LNQLNGQIMLPGIDDHFLNERLEESRRVVAQVAAMSEKPLIIQFSGGRDSMAMVELVREVTDNFVACYMISGIDFPESVAFAGESAAKLQVPIIYSRPEDHKGGLFQRLEQFGKWPAVRSLWCQRDLKVRAEKKRLNKTFGRGTFYKLVGVRRYESNRRKYIYPLNMFMRKDPDVTSDVQVFPIVHWTGDDVKNYLAMKKSPESSLYKKYGVSGCYWCPFYQHDIYRSVLADHPDRYDEFIWWEKKLQIPSIINNTFLRDLKAQIVVE
jgi:phosphoadenosine phosphosulfate reductase